MKSPVLIISLIHLLSCRSSVQKEAECSNIFQAPRVKELGVETLYKEACWQLYKVNLLQTDSFVVEGPYLDSVFTEVALSEFNLELTDVKQIGDSITFFLPFERGVVPESEGSYFRTASFWQNTQKVTIGDDIIITWDRDIDNANFEKYLKTHSDKLSPMLYCLAVERGVFL